MNRVASGDEKIERSLDEIVRSDVIRSELTREGVRRTLVQGSLKVKDQSSMED
jgi:hypothetical protein